MHPHFEKGLTWEPSRIELLWGSMLRGLPIGSFTTCLSPDGSEELLIDGEQRCLAIALGMVEPEFNKLYHNPDFILWIDLEPNIAPYSEREFLIRLATADHPWGFGKSDDCPPLPPEEMRDSLSQIGLFPGAPDYMGKRPRPRCLYPWAASVPVPLGWLNEEKEKTSGPFWEAIAKRVLFSGQVHPERVLRFLENRSEAAQKSREKIYAAVVSLIRYRIISVCLPPSFSSQEKFMDSHLRRLHSGATKVDGAAGLFLKSTADQPRLRSEIRRLAKWRMPPEHLFALIVAAAAWKQDEDLFLNPICYLSLRDFIQSDAANCNAVENFMIGLESRLERIEKLLLYDSLNSPRGILPAHLASIARDQPELYVFLLAQEGTEEEELAMLVPGNIGREQLVNAVTSIAWLAKDVRAAVKECRTHARVSTPGLMMAECEERGLLPESLHEDGFFESELKHHPLAWRKLLLYAQRDYISGHFHSFDPSRTDHWEGRNLPWTFDFLMFSKESPEGWMGWYGDVLESWYYVGNLRVCPAEASLSQTLCNDFHPELLTQAFLEQEEADAFSKSLDTIMGKRELEEIAATWRNRTRRIFREWQYNG